MAGNICKYFSNYSINTRRKFQHFLSLFFFSRQRNECCKKSYNAHKWWSNHMFIAKMIAPFGTGIDPKNLVVSSLNLDALNR